MWTSSFQGDRVTWFHSWDEPEGRGGASARRPSRVSGRTAVSPEGTLMRSFKCVPRWQLGHCASHSPPDRCPQIWSRLPSGRTLCSRPPRPRSHGTAEAHRYEPSQLDRSATATGVRDHPEAGGRGGGTRGLPHPRGITESVCGGVRCRSAP